MAIGINRVFDAVNASCLVKPFETKEVPPEVLNPACEFTKGKRARNSLNGTVLGFKGNESDLNEAIFINTPGQVFEGRKILAYVHLRSDHFVRGPHDTTQRGPRRELNRG